MCVIVYKPQGNRLPSEKDLRACFKANPDGAGLMWAEGGCVHIRKGFMTWESFRDALSQRDWTGVQLVMHFRITTQGGVKPGLTHPFPICSSYEAMKCTSIRCKAAMAHNGIISAASDGAEGHNDSMRFIKDLAYPSLKANGFIESDVICDLLGNAAMGSRLAFMFGDGTVRLTGSWSERKDGCHYSNLNAFPKEMNYARRCYWGGFGY